MMTRVFTGVVLCGVAAGLAQGATIRYKASGPWQELTADTGDANGWQSAQAPSSLDTVRANWGGATITLDYATTVNQFQAGVDESGTFHVLSGGILSTAGGNNKIGNNTPNNAANANYNSPVTGRLIVDAGGEVNSTGWLMIAGNNGALTGIADIYGTLNSASHLWMATGGQKDGIGAASNGILNIYNGGIVNVGGNIGLGTVNASTPSGGTATITVSMGGILNLNQWSATGSIQDGSVLNIHQGGMVTVGGNRVADAENYFAAGKIASDLGEIMATFDSGANLTTIVAIPEPATLGLLGVIGAAGLLRRRRS